MRVWAKGVGPYLTSRSVSACDATATQRKVSGNSPRICVPLILFVDHVLATNGTNDKLDSVGSWSDAMPCASRDDEADCEY